MANTKQQVREFYDQIGWSQVGDGLYQNARYEDLRPVSRDYIHNCHLRVTHHLAPSGDFLLDAGSGPVQWPEYLTYSENYRYRLCADISITALKEAREKLGNHGLYVVADIANLPFKADAFDGEVSMHAIHHLPLSEHKRAYMELQRALKPERSAVIVNGWHNPLLMRLAELGRRRRSGRHICRETDTRLVETGIERCRGLQGVSLAQFEPAFHALVRAPAVWWQSLPALHFLDGREVPRVLWQARTISDDRDSEIKPCQNSPTRNIFEPTSIATHPT